MASNFWQLEHRAENPAVVIAQTGQQKTYDELSRGVERIASAMSALPRNSLLMLLAQNRYECLVVYLAALRARRALLLADATLNEALLQQLVSTYRPDFIYTSNPYHLEGYGNRTESGLTVYQRERKEPVSVCDSLALLLNTSGSTGSPKLVRLSLTNLEANAASIASYLNLTAGERPITSLPMSYSYGLSVINSHLLAGACLVLTDHGVLRREFWDAVDGHSCTSFAGVPYTYQMLLKTGLLTQRGATLRTLTQAGGALAPEDIRKMHQLAGERGFRFFVMYGQTEATARIAYVPFEALGSKIGSIGVPIPGGSLQVEAASGELIYAGRNVMLGYAECREDLSKGDELHGVLQTGDQARQDEDGFFYITGRLKRFLKLFGKRCNLDEVEHMVEQQFGIPVACFGTDDLLMAAVEGKLADATAISEMLRKTLNLPASHIRVEAIDRLPRTTRGKTNYQALAQQRASNATQAQMEMTRP